MPIRRIALLLLAGAAAACGPTLATRYATGNAALSTPEGAMYFVALSPVLQQALNRCIPANEHSASPTMVVVADIDAGGAPSAVRVEPASDQASCIARQLAASTFPKPPLGAGAPLFPIGIRVDDSK